MIGASFALALAASSPATLADVLQSHVDVEAVERFATVWRQSDGKPDAGRLQSGYLAGGGRALEIFTNGRIVSADHLARTVAAHPDVYRDAIDRCMPWAMDQDGSFRAINFGLKGLLPNRTPPAVAVLFGANNSGGTAQEGMQVIGLEVICRLSPDRASFDQRMRGFFAHEATHTFQKVAGPKAEADLLLSQVILEGTADYVSHVITGLDPDPQRSAWAASMGDAIWPEFLGDRARVSGGLMPDGELNEVGKKAASRWVMNAGSPPSGWPSEAGYWVGEQIVRAYVDASSDPAAALDHLLQFDDPKPILDRAATRIPGLKKALAEAAHP